MIGDVGGRPENNFKAGQGGVGTLICVDMAGVNRGRQRWHPILQRIEGCQALARKGFAPGESCSYKRLLGSFLTRGFPVHP